MADASIELQATDLFGYPASFKVQTSTTSDPLTNLTNMDEDGNVSCERNIVDITNYTQSMTYCGSTFKSDLEDAPEYILIGFGSALISGILSETLTINMTAGDYCTLDVAGHNHSENPHDTTRYADFATVPVLVSSLFATWDGFGVPSFGIAVTDASPSSATLTFSVNHIDEISEDGTHLVGTNSSGRVELSMDFSGIPDNPTLSGIQTELRALGGAWVDAYVDSTDTSDSNSDFDTFSFVAHINVDADL